MGPLLDGLVKLQEVENRLRAIQSKVNRCKKAVIFQENQLRQLQSSLAARQEEIKLTRIQSDRLEVDLKSKDEYIAKMRAALNMAKSNKEYAAILTELNTAKADNTKLETQILELMKTVETDQAECEELQKQIDQKITDLEELRKNSQAQVDELQKDVDVIQTEWDQAAADTPKDILDIFKRVAESYDGEAIAHIEKQNERTGVFSCSGCFMRVPDEIANKLLTNDEIIRCSNCTRILVMTEL